MARKRIRDAIAELSDSGDQQDLDLGQAENTRSFDFQMLAEELRRASHSPKRGATGGVEHKKDRSSADRPPDNATGDMPSAVPQDGGATRVRQRKAQPSGAGHPDAPTEGIPPLAATEPEAPIKLTPSEAARPSVSLAIVTSRHDEVHLDAQSKIGPTEAETAERGAATTPEPIDQEGAPNSDANSVRWRQTLDRLKVVIYAVLNTDNRRMTALLLVPVLLGAFGSFIISALSPTIYGARSEIVFSLRNMDWNLAERFLGTQLVIVQSRTTLGPVAQQFSIPISKLKDDLTVEIVRSSTVMRIEYRHHNAAAARDIVNAITDRYLLALREFEQVEGGSHRLLTPALLLDDPIAPHPLRAAAIGALVGLAIAAAAIVLRAQVRAAPRDGTTT